MQAAAVREFFAEHPLERARVAHVLVPLSVLFYTLLFVFLQTAAPLRRLQERFTQERRTDWNQRLTECVNAVVLVTGCGVVAASARLDDPAWAFSYAFAPELFHSAFLGFLIFDTGFNFFYRATHWDTCDLLHHAAYGVLVAVHLRFGCSLYKAQFLWLTVGELIVPLQQLRWHLAVAGHKDTRLYKATKVALLMVFLSARLLPFAWGLVRSWDHMWNAYTAVPLSPRLHQGLYLLISCVFVLNLYWFEMLAVGVMRSLRQSSGLKLAALRPAMSHAPLESSLELQAPAILRRAGSGHKCALHWPAQARGRLINLVAVSSMQGLRHQRL